MKSWVPRDAEWFDDRAPDIMLGALTIVPGARMVTINGAGIDIGSRAFDLLMVLANAQGDIVSKETIMAEVWPTTTVVDSNLKVQLSILRRALGAERWRIKTVSGRGYLLVLDDRAPVPVAAKPLVIVFDADLAAQAQMMRIVSDAAGKIGGVASLSILTAGEQPN